MTEIKIADLCVCPECFIVDEGPMKVGARCIHCNYLFTEADKRKSDEIDRELMTSNPEKSK